MGSMSTIKLLLLALFVYNGVEGRLTREDLKIEEQLRILNKSPIKTFQDEAGGLCDCIDILKQPAFDHPFLRDHKIQMKPTWVTDDEMPPQYDNLGIFKGVECPEGTVPIRRTRKEDLVRANLSYPIHPQGVYPGPNLAMVMNKDPNKSIFFGAQSITSVPNPSVDDDQASMGFVIVGTGEKGSLEQMAAGWAVYPAVYGDHNTHFTVYWNNEKRANGFCFNMMCPGFVQVDDRIPLGQLLNETSKYGGPQIAMEILILQDQTTKNWWVSLPRAHVNIGYWPASLFPSLDGGATYVYFGGMTRGPADKARPPMGLGTLPERNNDHSTYFVNMHVYNTAGAVGLEGDWGEFTDCPASYHAEFYGIDGNNGYSMTYGGPGGKCED